MFSRPAAKPENLTVTLVTPDAALEKGLRDAFAKQQRYSLKTLNGTLRGQELALLNELNTSAMIVELEAGNTDDLAALERVRQAEASIPVLVVADKLYESTARQLLRLHVADWIPKPRGAEETLEACERAIAQARAASAAAATGAVEALCYGFVPASGGAGATLLAIESAFLLARRAKRHDTTCVVDLNFQDGAIAEYLNVQPNLQLEELSPERLDRQLLEVMVSRHSSGLALLAAPNTLTDFGHAHPDLVTRLLDLASASFEHVIIDLPRQWMPWSEDVLLGCNKVFIVTVMTVPGLRRARILADAYRTRCGEELTAAVIMNKDENRLFGNTLKRRDVEQVLGERLAGYVSRRDAVAKEAIDRGIPLLELRKSNKIDKDLTRILFTP